jgi:type VI secretion system protein ImpK
MSNGDDSGEGNRTVFRPSPLAGLGQPRPAPEPPSGRTTEQPPAGASSVQAAPLAGMATTAPRQKRLSDEGIPAPAAAAEIRVPLVSQAGPLLALVASIRSGRARIGMADFHREAEAMLSAYRQAIAPHYPDETRRAATYLLAATVDDIAGNLPDLDGSGGWQGRSLAPAQTDGFGEDELWGEIDRALDKPEDNTDILELAHACIAAGFMGRYRQQAGGGDQIEALNERLYKALDHTRALSQRFVSPQWVGFNAPLQKVPAISIIGLALAGALLLVLLAYVGLRLTTQAGDADVTGAGGSAAGTQENAA